ncbi:hypothetical protein LTR86_009398 [Recurvomyces mirabilis]|nr:hypothetical protein LTR86_009398 [Recurvomyces mirabilis]
MRRALIIVNQRTSHISFRHTTADSASLVQQKCYSDKAGSKPATPFEGYYADLLDAPLRSMQSATRTPAAPPPSIDETSMTADEERLAKFRTVFGSRGANASERQQQIEAGSQTIAGVVVPPRPEEPENCCMSGCVNCVWDQYRDEMEEWALKSAEARTQMAVEWKEDNATGMMMKESRAPAHVATSVDDDGGGSESAWNGGQDGAADLFADIPVGIREFMRTEKKLKERRRREAAEGG